MSHMVAGYPATSARCRGWLRYLYRKATTPDDWSKEGRPHPHWDGVSNEPTLSWHRFDLIESSCAVALMADATPAWREIYSRVLDELIDRHTGYWAAKDWLEQIGPDPRRASYPEAWYAYFMAPWLRGTYDVPGWTANGVEPWGLQMDPIGADGNLFFQGLLSADARPAPLRVGRRQVGAAVRDDPRRRQHVYVVARGIAELLAEQWRARHEGCHCENTKIWPV